jgi:hypothetical protein
MFDLVTRSLYPCFDNGKRGLMTKKVHTFSNFVTLTLGRLIRRYCSQLSAGVYPWRLAALVIANGQQEDTKDGGTTGVQTGELALIWPNGAVSAVFR